MATYGAQYASLFLGRSDNSIAGVGYMPGDQTVVLSSWADVAFPHELGHNYGCNHDRGTAGIPTGSGYNYGYKINTGAGLFISLMSYMPGSYIPYYSDPNVTYLGAATGVPIGSPAAADNAQVIRNSAPASAPLGVNQRPVVQVTSPPTGDSLLGWSRRDYTIDFDAEMDLDNGYGDFGSAFRATITSPTVADYYSVLMNTNPENLVPHWQAVLFSDTQGYRYLDGVGFGSGLATPAYPPGTWVHFRTVVSGSRQQTFVDFGSGETLLFDFTDMSLPAGGVGFHADFIQGINRIRFDNLVVRSCAATPTSSPTPTATFTPTLTSLLTSTWTVTPTGVIVVDDFPTLTPTPSPSDTPTDSPTATWTMTWTDTPTATWSVTPIPPSPTPVQPLHVWPNPYNPSQAVGGTLKAWCMPPGSELDVYTVSGESVFTQMEIGGWVRWNGRSPGGKPAAPGIHYYVVRKGPEKLTRGVLVIEGS